jgi:pyrimidine-nucleoside phosphorylase
MDIPLGNAIGNALEVEEAIDTLNGKGKNDFVEICLALATEMLYLAGKGNREVCYNMALESIKNGSAKQTFKNMIKAQGGDERVVDCTDYLPKSKYSYDIIARESGYISAINTEGYGLCALHLGAGRNKVGDSIDYSAGIILNKKTGDKIEKGEKIATLFANDKNLFAKAEETFLQSTQIDNCKPQSRPLILAKVE